MKAQAQQNADDQSTYWKPRCREREGVRPGWGGWGGEGMVYSLTARDSHARDLF